MRQNSNITLAGMAVLTALALYLCYLLFQPFAGPILFALVVAIIFHPVHKYSRRWIRNPSAAALASMLAAMALAAIPLFLLGMAVSNELASLYKSLAAKSAEQGGPAAYAFGVLQNIATWLGKHFSLPAVDVRAIIMRRIEEASTWLVRSGAGLLGNVVTFIRDAVIASLVLFFLFRDGESFLAQLSAVLPLGQRRMAELQQRISSTVVANFYGGVAVGAAQGALTGLTFWALGVGSPVLWGVVTAICSLVPVVGSAAVWVPASVVLVFSGHVAKGIVLLALGTGVIGLADNVIRPLIVSEAVRLHTIYIFFALLGGLQVFGPVGLFLGPVILSVTGALLTMMREEFQNRTS